MKTTEGQFLRSNSERILKPKKCWLTVSGQRVDGAYRGALGRVEREPDATPARDRFALQKTPHLARKLSSGLSRKSGLRSRPFPAAVVRVDRPRMEAIRSDDDEGTSGSHHTVG